MPTSEHIQKNGAVALRTERLLIRDHIAGDLQDHHELFSDQEVMRYTFGIQTNTPDESKANLEAAMDQIGIDNRKLYFFRIEERTTGLHLGEIGYTVTEFCPVGKIVEMGYFIRKKHWGKGLTTEACKEVMRFAFEENSVIRICAGCLAENYGSEKVMIHCSMKKEGHFREYQWHEGKLKDRLYYGLLKSEWQKLRASENE